MTLISDAARAIRENLEFCDNCDQDTDYAAQAAFRIFLQALKEPSEGMLKLACKDHYKREGGCYHTESYRKILRALASHMEGEG